MSKVEPINPEVRPAPAQAVRPANSSPKREPAAVEEPKAAAGDETNRERVNPSRIPRPLGVMQHPGLVYAPGHPAADAAGMIAFPGLRIGDGPVRMMLMGPTEDQAKATYAQFPDRSADSAQPEDSQSEATQPS